MKKIILGMLLLNISLFASVLEFWVDTPEMVDMYFLIFSAISRVFASGDYVSLLRLVFLVGGVMVFAGGLFKSFGSGGGEGALGGYLKYLIVGVALLTLVFWTGSTDIAIKAKYMPNVCDMSPTAPVNSNARVVPAGTPMLVAYGFYFTNQIGTTLTDLAVESYSTVYSDPYAGMNKNGGYMGALKGAMRLMALDPNKITLKQSSREANGTKEDFIPFDMGKAFKAMFTDCILVPFSAKGIVGEQEIAKLKSSSNLMETLSELYTGPGVNVGGVNSKDFSLSYQGEIHNCGKFYTDKIKVYADDFKVAANCGIPVGYGAVALITGATTAPESKFQQVAIQAGLVSQLEESTTALGIGVSGVSYASGKTRAEFIQSSLASGAYMSEMLPYLQMTIRAILYAFFPFVFVIVLLPGGLTVLGNYAQSLIWVELWSPTAAILDLFMSAHAKKEIGDIYGGEGMTMMSSIDMLSAGSTIAGVAGYLYMSVPALTWLILKGSAQMLQGITAATAAGMAKNITTDEMNRDSSLIAKTQEASARSGKDISMAEMQHYEAIQSGRVEGAKLGIEMNARDGMNTIADMEAARIEQGISKYVNTAEATGIHGAAQGALLGEKESMKNRSDIKTINGLTKAQIEDSTEMDSRKDRGAIKANVEDNFSEDTYKNEQHQNNTKTKINSKIHSDIGRKAQVDTKVTAERHSLAKTNADEKYGGVKTIDQVAENNGVAARITNSANDLKNKNGLTEDVRAHLEAESAEQTAGTIISTRDQGGYNQTYAAATVAGRQTRIALDAINRKEANGVTESKESEAEAKVAETGLYEADVNKKAMLIRKASMGANQEAATDALGKINQVRSTQTIAEEQEQQRIDGITTTDLADAAMTGTRINVSSMAAKRAVADSMGVSVEKMTDGDVIGKKVYSYDPKTKKIHETSYGRDENDKIVMTRREVTNGGMTEYNKQIRDKLVRTMGGEDIPENQKSRALIQKIMGGGAEAAGGMKTISAFTKVNSFKKFAIAAGASGAMVGSGMTIGAIAKSMNLDASEETIDKINKNMKTSGFAKGKGNEQTTGSKNNGFEDWDYSI